MLRNNTVRYLIVVQLIFATAACSTYAVPRYSISAENVVALRAFKGQLINVGAFTAAEPGQTEILCRAVGPIATPDGNSFADFIRNALVTELKFAETYATGAPVTLTGRVDEIDFSSTSGKWTIRLTVRSSNGQSLSIEERYGFTTSFNGETACNQTAQALVPAVQNVINKLVSAPKFGELIRSAAAAPLPERTVAR